MATLRTRVGPKSIKMELVTMIPESAGITSRVVEAMQEKIVQGLPTVEELENVQTAIEDMLNSKGQSSGTTTVRRCTRRWL